LVWKGSPTARAEPYRYANQLPTQIETLIVRLKQDKPNWGAPKIKERLARLYPEVHMPAVSAVHAVLDSHGLVQRRTGRRNRAEGTTLSRPFQPNEPWCADYKGEFMLADRRYCYPLTVGIKQTDDRIWLVSFMSYDLGYFDDETCRLEPLTNPFGPKVLPKSSE
jgi:hypothetical protein